MTDPIARVQTAAPLPAATAARPSSRAKMIAARVTGDAYAPGPAPGVTRNAVTVLIDGRQAFPEMFSLVAAAQKSIQVEFFIIHDDATTWQFARLLAEKARRGVDVKMLYDPNGSSDFSAKLTATMSHGLDAKVLFSRADVNRVVDFLKTNGVQILPSVKKSIMYSDVDHRKFLLVDGKAGITGGMNIGDEYRHEWHDLMLRLDGPGVAGMQKKFFESWRKAGGRGDERPYLAPTLASPPGGIRTYAASVARDDRSFKRMLLAAVDAAQSSIQMETAYLGDKDLHARLKAAAHRGVKVTLVLPDFSDVAPLNYPNRAFLDDLRAAGIRVYLFNGGEKGFLHVKATVIDGHWVTLGSANADHKAMVKNREYNLIFNDEALASSLDRELFARDIANSTAVTKRQSPWYLRPLSALARLAYKLY